MKVLIVSLCIVLVDQVSKLIARGISIPFLGIDWQGLNHGQRNTVWGDVFNITLVENPGIAFGINPGTELKLVISILTLAACIGLFIYLYKIKTEKLSSRFAIAMILGGAVGNLIDRTFYGLIYGYAPLFHGSVVDFFDIRIFELFLFNSTIGTYIFNIADVAVTIGVVILLFSLRKQPDRNSVVDESAIVTENQD
ncbi:MAG: signal peptidase II [Ignavibacteriales bacterium]|nr:MAG: signal peptidase II [Ignavibacteriales bacterium]